MSMDTTIHELSVYADYNSFFLIDEDAKVPGPKDGWIGEVIKDLISARPGAVAMGTVRRMTVPVTIAVSAHAPEVDLQPWDHVTEASITTTTGVLLVLGPIDQSEKAPRITVSPGTYRIRFSAGGFNTLSEDGLDGDDKYHIAIWPSEPESVRVLKRYPAPFPGG